MATATEIMEMLRPLGGWSVSGENFDGINCFDCQPVTKSEFDEGFAQYDSWKAQAKADRATAKAAAEAKLAALGLTTDDLKALGLGGN